MAQVEANFGAAVRACDRKDHYDSLTLENNSAASLLARS